MAIETIASDSWTLVISASATAMVMESKVPALYATVNEPTDFDDGISAVPFYQVIVPAGVDVYMRSTGVAEGKVVTQVFGT